MHPAKVAGQLRPAEYELEVKASIFLRHLFHDRPEHVVPVSAIVDLHLGVLAEEVYVDGGYAHAADLCILP